MTSIFEMLVEGQQVLLRDFSTRGRPVVHQILRASKDDGSVYTVAPVADLTWAHQVHRSLWLCYRTPCLLQSAQVNRCLLILPLRIGLPRMTPILTLT